LNNASDGEVKCGDVMKWRWAVSFIKMRGDKRDTFFRKERENYVMSVFKLDAALPKLRGELGLKLLPFNGGYKWLCDSRRCCVGKLWR
jgi:hypothetical protein